MSKLSTRLATAAAAFAVLAAGVLGAGGVAIGAAASSRCSARAPTIDSRAAKLVRATNSVRLFRVFRPNLQQTDYFACLVPHGRLQPAAHSDAPDPEYGSDRKIGKISIVGDFVAVVEVLGAATRTACEKYQGSGCPAVMRVERVLDLAHTRSCSGPVLPQQTLRVALAQPWSCPLGSTQTQ